MQLFNHAFAYAMATIHSTSRRQEERGASMVEYVVLVVLIAALVGGVIAAFGDKIMDFVDTADLPSDANGAVTEG